MTDVTVPADVIGSTEVLTKGTFGIICRVPEVRLPDVPGPLIYKRYKKKVNVAAGTLIDLSRLRCRMEDKQRQQFDQRAIWPLRVVMDGSRAVGVLMREIPKTFFHDFALPTSSRQRQQRFRALELQYLLQEQDYCREIGIPYLDDRQRLDVLVRLARALAMVHKAGGVYGDFSARNCVVRVSPKPAVLLIDCDSARIRGGISAFGKQPHTPNWQPPEALAAEAALRRLGASPDPARARELQITYSIQTISTDIYKYGLAVVRLLAPTAGNSQNRDPRSVEHKLHPIARDLLRRSLGDDPKRRPTMSDWFYGLHGRYGP